MTAGTAAVVDERGLGDREERRHLVGDRHERGRGVEGAALGERGIDQVAAQGVALVSGGRPGLALALMVDDAHLLDDATRLAIAEGTRRDASISVGDPTVRTVEPGVVEVAFTLPGGAYATAVMRELTKSS